MKSALLSRDSYKTRETTFRSQSSLPYFVLSTISFLCPKSLFSQTNVSASIPDFINALSEVDSCL